MFNKPTSIFNVLLVATVVMIFAGCSSAGKKPVGAHARAEKGMTGSGGGMDAGGMQERDPLAGSPIPLGEFLQSEGEPSMCTRIHFDYDKSDVKSEFQDCLNRIAAVLNKYPDVDVLVEGHCDERGTPEYNLALGERRAVNTSAYLIDQGIDSSRLTTRSMGEEQPLELCSNESCWKQNRRADFYVIKK